MSRHGTLYQAIVDNDVDKVCRLIDEQQVKADSNKNKPLMRASRYGFLEIVRELILRGADPSVCDYLPLRQACFEGYLDIVEELLKYGGLEASNYGAFRSAILGGHLEIVKLLHELGTPLDIGNNFALKWAKRYKYYDIIDYLREHGIM